MIKVGIIGGTGYTGAELLRLLATHPDCQIEVVASRSEAGQPVADVYPNLRGFVENVFEQPDNAAFADCDVVFSATPNGIAMQHAPALLEQGIKFIDLAADFRIQDVAVWEHWYSMQHACPNLLSSAVYGLPELNRDQIKQAQLIANPGCYPTATTLGLLPLMQNDVLDNVSIVVDAKSGVTGAGRSASVANLFSEVTESFKAYGAAAHRHHPEISQTLSAAAKQPVSLTFVPHLVPMLRGIEASIYVDLKQGVSLEQVRDLYQSSYQDEPFVDLMPEGAHPETRSVKSSNMCRIALYQATGSGKLVVSSVIDNLVKGAAGQAIQNMNLMFDLPETQGLATPGLQP